MIAKEMRDMFPVFALLYSATLWGVLWYPLRLLEQAGLRGLWATAAIFFAALCGGVWFALPGWRDLLRQPWSLLGLAAANGWCNVAFILAVLDGNVVRVTLLFFLSPLWAALLGWVMLREPMSRRAIVVLLVAMAGALVMLWDPALGYPWPQSTADWLAISSGVSFALSNVFVRKTQAIALPVKTAFAWIGVAATAMLWIVLTGDALPQVNASVWWSAAALGLFGIMTMTFAVQYGVTRMPVHRSAVILLFELVASTASSQWLTNETVQAREWFGGALIALAAYFSARSQMERRNED